MKKREYRFYGWEKAVFTDSRGLSPRNYFDLLSNIWSADTCAPRMRKSWSSENKTLGQCSITAFLLQELFGGKVYGVPLGDGSYHCFNAVDGHVFDLTSEQFGERTLNYENCPEQNREVHFAKEEKRLRYERLKTELFAFLPCIRPISLEHAAQYGKIYADAFSGPPWNDPWKPEDAEIHVRELAESRTSYGLECVVGDQVAAFLLGTSMLFHYGRTFEINDLAVAQAFQGRGIASILLERCIADMKERGIVGMHLITRGQSFLPEFYGNYGFRQEQEVILMGMEL